MPENIIKSYECDDLISFKLECDCCGHDMSVILQKDDDGVSLTIDDHACISARDDGLSFMGKIIRRICVAWDVLLNGTSTLSYSFIFKGDEQLNEFVDFLSEKSKKIIGKSK